LTSIAHALMAMRVSAPNPAPGISNEPKLEAIEIARCREDRLRHLVADRAHARSPVSPCTRRPKISAGGRLRRAVSIEQPIQRAAGAGIGQVRDLSGADAELAGGGGGGGLLLAVDRLALDDDRAQQHAEGFGVGDGGAAVEVAAIQMPGENLAQAAAIEEVVDEGKWSQPLGDPAIRMAGPSCDRATATPIKDEALARYPPVSS
jgi:hypothetical protein